MCKQAISGNACYTKPHGKGGGAVMALGATCPACNALAKLPGARGNGPVPYRPGVSGLPMRAVGARQPSYNAMRRMAGR